jgi:hypothetical protein
MIGETTSQKTAPFVGEENGGDDRSRKMSFVFDFTY